MNRLNAPWRPCESGACWVFPLRPADCVNQLVDFFQTFTCDAAVDAELRISADTDFVVWLNGRRIGSGQYSDFPGRKTFERFALTGALVPGRNRLALTVYYNGRTSSVYTRGRPGVVFVVAADGVTLAASGTHTLCRANPCYHSGPIASVSHQLFHTFGYDARGEDGHDRADYEPGPEWSAIADAEATQPEDRAVLLPRPVLRLEEQGLTAGRLHATGVFIRDTTLAEAQSRATAVGQSLAGLQMSDGTVLSAAWQMQHDALSARTSHQVFGRPMGTDLAGVAGGLTARPGLCRDGEGLYVVIDMEQQEVGHLEFDLEAPEGTVLDFGYGEHLEDLRVRTFVGGRNFAARYICRAGRQQFVHHFQRWAGRYLALHCASPSVTLFRVNLRRRVYPVSVQSRLTTGNDLHARILEVAQRTLHCCMHEHYEDTPWREQALYANDARTQALCGYYAYGETAFPHSSFSLLGRGLRSDGFLSLTAPGTPGLTIPSFTFCWMLAVRDHFLYSGDDTLAREFLPQIRAMLDGFLRQRRKGLLPLRHADGIWHFYDWSGMSGYSDAEFDAGLETDAPLNCFLVLALEAVQSMLGWLGEADDPELASAIDEVRAGVAERFWDEDRGVFRTHESASTVTQLTQALAVLAGVGTASQRDSALSRMVDEDANLVAPGLSQTLYTFSALMTRHERFGVHVLRDIDQTWGRMLQAGATTFWETIKGAADFHNAGSLCHAWSAVPLYVYYHNLLGVRPTAPGFRAFVVDPVKGYLDRCRGRVPTPLGPIEVAWTTTPEKTLYRIDAPNASQCELLDREGILGE